jgi:hypothetical protein
MKSLIEAAHPDLSIGELCRTIEEKKRPVRRSPHIGNIQPKDMAVMAGLPEGVEVLLVSTIQGDDKITRPHVVQLSRETEIPLTSRSAARNRVVGAVAIRQTDPSMIEELPVAPKSGQTLSDYHMEALSRLTLTNQPICMMKRFGRNPDLLMATAEACREQGCLHRIVGEDGKIMTNADPDLQQVGLYGIDDATPAEMGALLPLNGMITMDMLLSEDAGSSQTLHLGGGDMVCYTRDQERMEDISTLKARASAQLGHCALRHLYIVVDCRGLAVMVPEVSQHELLVTGRIIDPSEHLDKSCGGSNE